MSTQEPALSDPRAHALRQGLAKDFLKEMKSEFFRLCKLQSWLSQCGAAADFDTHRVGK